MDNEENDSKRFSNQTIVKNLNSTKNIINDLRYKGIAGEDADFVFDKVNFIESKIDEGLLGIEYLLQLNNSLSTHNQYLVRHNIWLQERVEWLVSQEIKKEKANGTKNTI